MKKFIMFALMLALAFNLAACSSSNNSSSNKKDKKETASSAADLKKPLVKFYMNLSKVINAKDVDLNQYEKADQPTPEMKNAASESAAAVVAELNKVSIPAQLDSKKSEIKTAMKDLTDSYQMKVDELKKDNPSLDAANAAFTKGEDELGQVFLSVKLLKPSLLKEVQ